MTKRAHETFFRSGGVTVREGSVVLDNDPAVAADPAAFDDLGAQAQSFGLIGRHFRTGRWYPPFGTGGTIKLFNGFEFCVPMPMQIEKVFAAIGVNVTTAGAGAGTVRFGWRYDNGSIYPGALGADLGTIATPSAAGFAQLAASLDLPSGLCWLSVLGLGATTEPTVQALNATGGQPILGAANPGEDGRVAGYLSPGGQTGLAATFPAGATFAASANGAPFISVKAA